MITIDNYMDYGFGFIHKQYNIDILYKNSFISRLPIQQINLEDSFIHIINVYYNGELANNRQQKLNKI